MKRFTILAIVFLLTAPLVSGRDKNPPDEVIQARTAVLLVSGSGMSDLETAAARFKAESELKKIGYSALTSMTDAEVLSAADSAKLKESPDIVISLKVDTWKTSNYATKQIYDLPRATLIVFRGSKFKAEPLATLNEKPLWSRYEYHSGDVAGDVVAKFVDSILKAKSSSR